MPDLTPQTSKSNLRTSALCTERGVNPTRSLPEFRNFEQSWGVTGATEAEVACFKTHGWCVAIYATHLLSLIKVLLPSEQGTDTNVPRTFA